MSEAVIAGKMPALPAYVDRFMPTAYYLPLFRVSIALVFIRTLARALLATCSPISPWSSLLRLPFRSSDISALVRFLVLLALLGVASYTSTAQQTNPVDRK